MARLVPFLALGLLAGACADDPIRPGVNDVPAADVDCLRFLQEHHVSFNAPPTRGIRTPIEVEGKIGGVALVPRGGRPALMDCELGRALVEAAPVFRRLGVAELSYSGAYDYRTRRDSSQLSAHAHGLAIDVHALAGSFGTLNIARDFEKGAGQWRDLRTKEGNMAGCIGEPRTEGGRRLRTLVCRLKHHSAFRVIVTPDDNADHRDHIHLEAYPDPVTRISRVMGILPYR